MAFLAANDLADAVAEALGCPTNQLPRQVSDAVGQANADAIACIKAELCGNRDYSPTQAAAWDQGASFNRDIGIYFALVRAGGAHNLSDQALARFDRRKELATTGVLIGGVAVQPGDDPTKGGAIGHGRLNHTPHVHVYPPGCHDRWGWR